MNSYYRMTSSVGVIVSTTMHIRDSSGVFPIARNSSDPMLRALSGILLRAAGVNVKRYDVPVI